MNQNEQEREGSGEWGLNRKKGAIPKEAIKKKLEWLGRRMENRKGEKEERRRFTKPMRSIKN